MLGSHSVMYQPIMYDDLKEGILNGRFRTKLREYFPKEMKKLEDAEANTEGCCNAGVVMHWIGMIQFQCRAKRLSKQELA